MIHDFDDDLIRVRELSSAEYEFLDTVRIWVACLPALMYISLVLMIMTVIIKIGGGDINYLVPITLGLIALVSYRISVRCKKIITMMKFYYYQD